MPPRLALRRLWLMLRLTCIASSVLGIVWVTTVFFAYSFLLRDSLFVGILFFCIICLFASLFLTPANRGRIHRLLGRLNGRGSEEEEAAAISALVAGADPDEVLANAIQQFRCLPANELYADDLADNSHAPVGGPTLRERTKPAVMGEVSAFLSHSWSDEQEAPGAKFAAVTRWARRHQELTGEEPTIWLDKARCLGHARLVSARLL